MTTQILHEFILPKKAQSLHPTHLQQISEFRSQSSEVKQPLYLALRLNLCTTLNLKSAVSELITVP